MLSGWRGLVACPRLDSAVGPNIGCGEFGRTRWMYDSFRSQVMTPFAGASSGLIYPGWVGAVKKNFVLTLFEREVARSRSREE